MVHCLPAVGRYFVLGIDLGTLYLILSTKFYLILATKY